MQIQILVFTVFFAFLIYQGNMVGTGTKPMTVPVSLDKKKPSPSSKMFEELYHWHQRGYTSEK
jgi:hypothetical protein